MNADNSNAETAYTFGSNNSNVSLETPPVNRAKFLNSLYEELMTDIQAAIKTFTAEKAAAISSTEYIRLSKQVKRFHTRMKEYTETMKKKQIKHFKRLDKQLIEALNELADMINEAQGIASNSNSNSNSNRNSNANSTRSRRKQNNRTRRN